MIVKIVSSSTTKLYRYLQLKWCVEYNPTCNPDEVDCKQTPPTNTSAQYQTQVSLLLLC